MTDNQNPEVDFDFGFENFRPMGFTYTGVVTSAKIEKPKNATFTFFDKRAGKEVTKEAKPQLVVLIQPTDHSTKSGNPYPEYLPLTHNSRSKLGIFIEHLKDLGISLGTDPSKIEGMEFQFEVKEIDFGGSEPTRINCPVAIVDALSGGTAAPAQAASAADTYADLPLNDIANALDGVDRTGAIAAAMKVAKDPRVVAGIADGSLISYLSDRGLLSEDGGRFVARVAAAV